MSEEDPELEDEGDEEDQEAPQHVDVFFGCSFKVEDQNEEFFKEYREPGYRDDKNEDYYDDLVLSERNALRTDATVTQSIERLWEMTSRDQNNLLDKENFQYLLLRICKTLNPDMRYLEAVQTVEFDWLKDSQSQRALTYEMFHASIFELVDLWCPELGNEAYAKFVEKLVFRLTVRIPKGLVTDPTFREVTFL